MAKSDVLAALEDDLANPGAMKSGEFLEQHAQNTARRFLEAGDRQGLVEVLRDWIAARTEPHTMLAVSITRRQRLLELVPDLRTLREEVDAGRAFHRFYLRWVDSALDDLSGN